jgi:hypothetical protein
MTIEIDATRQWAKDNLACWEVSPLVESHRGELMQVGFDLSLYARVPAMPDGDERSAALVARWEKLQQIALSLTPLLGGDGRIDVDPFDDARRLRPETQFAPEVMLQARLFHSSDYFTPASAADREGLRPIEERLGALGLRAKTW